MFSHKMNPQPLRVIKKPITTNTLQPGRYIFLSRHAGAIIISVHMLKSIHMLLETVDILRGLIAIRQRKPLCASVYVRECLCACVCSFAYVWI